MPAQIRCKEDNMSEASTFGHGEFIEHIVAYLSGGLEGAERSKFEDHRDACATCAAELQRAQDADAMLAGMFADAQPQGGFEDRIVRELRTMHRPRSLPHPMVLKVASGVAAAILLGAVGFVGNYLIENNKLPGAAKVEQRPLIGAVSGKKSDTWAFNVDAYTYWNEKDEKRDVEGEKATEERSQTGRVAGGTELAPKEAPVNRAEGLGFRGDRDGDGSKALGDVVADGEFDAIKQAGAQAAGEGKQQSGPGAPGGGGGGFGRFGGSGSGAGVPYGEKAPDDAITLTYGFGIPNGQTNLGLDAATTWGVNFNGGTLSGGVTTLSKSNSSLGRETKEAAGVTDTALRAGKPSSSPESNRYYAPMTGLGAVALGDELNKELKDQTKTGAERGFYAAESKSKSLEDAAPKANKKRAEAEKLAELALAVPDDSTGVANPQQGQPPQQTQQPQPNVQQPALAQRKIIRNGEMEFEVDSFDTSFLQISKIVPEEAGFVSSTDSEKLPNGKVRGTVVVRVPPEHLDTLVLKLRALGDLKSQKISAQDVTKAYYDIESELKAARAMEERLLNIIKSGKGEIKDLLAAEKELGVYRTKIEKLEGEIRYYTNFV